MQTDAILGFFLRQIMLHFWKVFRMEKFPASLYSMTGLKKSWQPQ
jgi:hypothetical protein